MMRWLLSFLPLSVSGQELLLNGGFEDENICTEYKINCAPQAWVCTVPSFSHYTNNAGLAHSGKKCIELIAAQKERPFFRSFIRTQLLCGLQKGKQYKLQLWVNGPQHVLDSAGIYFSASDFLYDPRPQNLIGASYYVKKFLQISVSATGWKRAAITFTATGSEAFLTIGNFRKTELSGAVVSGAGDAVFYVDDVSLQPADVHERLCADWQQQAQSILSYQNRHHLQAADMIRGYKKLPQTEKLPPTISIKIDTFTVPDVFFSTNSFLLHQKAFSRLDSFARWLSPQVIDSVVVHGHTDGAGREEDNRILSWRRAATVVAYLQKSAAKKFILYGWGSSRPVASNSTARSRQRNRRVEILLYRRLR